MLLGGRTAEELIFADPTTGAQNDIDRATTIARQMVTEFGMSDALGPMRFGHPQGEVFLGRDFTTHPRLLRRGRGEHRRRGARAHRRRARGRRATCSSTTARSSTGSARELIEHETLEAERVQELVRRRAHVGGRRRHRRRARRAGPRARRRRRAATRGRGDAVRPASAAPEDPRDRPEPVARGPDGPEPDDAHRPRPHRARGARDPRGDRRGPRPRRPGAHAAAHRQDVRGDLRRAARGPVAAPHRHVRGRPRRDGDGPRHPAALDVRAPSRPVRRAGPTSRTSPATTVASPGCRRSPGSSTGSPSARRCRSADHPDRRRAGRGPRRRAACSC